MKKLLVYISAMAMLALPTAVVLYESGGGFSIDTQGLQLLGLWALVLLFFQFILTARVRFLDRWFGLDRLTHLHGILGAAAMSTALLHMLLYVVPTYIILGIPFALASDWPIIPGSLALLLLLIIGLTASLYRSIGLSYQGWTRIHRAAYIVLPLVLLHGYLLGTHLSYHPLLQLQMLVLTAVVVWLLTARVIRSLYSRRHPQYVTDVQKLTGSITELRFTRPAGFRFVPGQFLFLRLRGRRLQEPPHPFTIASGRADDSLAIAAKASGDFTSQLDAVQPGDRLQIDGPYGVFHPLPEQQPVVWIAGGIGITPFLSCLRSLTASGSDAPPGITLIWANTTPQGVCCSQEFRQWSAHLPQLRIHHVFSQSSENPPDFGEVSTGRIDTELLARIAAVAAAAGTPRFYICGPAGLQRAVRASLRSLGYPSPEYERFSL